MCYGQHKPRWVPAVYCVTKPSERVANRQMTSTGLVWFGVDKALSARSGHCRAMGWRGWDWVGQKTAVERVAWQWLCGMPTPALCRGRLPSHWRPPLSGGGSRTATYPVADSHQARVNEGRTEERGPVIQRINRDLTSTGWIWCG